MKARAWVRLIGKELRAVGPVWLGAALTMAAVKTPHGQFDSVLRPIGALWYFLGTTALGAMSVGHEFNSGTWSLLLTQPLSRQRMILAKVGVLTALTLGLYGVAIELDVASVFRDVGPRGLWLWVGLAIFVAPWLTLMVRRAIGGAIFAAAIPGTLLFAGQVIGVRLYGYTADVDALANALVFWGVLIACSSGAVLGWRAFVRLELTDGGSRPVQPSEATANVRLRATLARSNPTVALFAKELRLQSLTLTIAAGYVAIYIASMLTAGGRPIFQTVAAVLTVIYASLLSMIAGAVAGAEERQIGTADSQLLLPIASSWQWTVKAATVLIVALGLGYELPRLLVWVLPPGFPAAHVVNERILPSPVEFGVVKFATLSLYVSSVCRTALGALISALPVFAVLFGLVSTFWDPIVGSAYGWVHASTPPDVRFYRETFGDAVMFTFIVLLGALLVRMALSNYRYADRSIPRLVAHAAVFAAALAVGLAIVGALGIRQLR